MALFLEPGVEGRLDGVPARYAPRLILSFNLFAGLPLKRVEATGIARPGTHGEIYFYVFAL
jgi:hypothetical protein